MTRNQQLMVMSAEIAMSLGLMYTGFTIYVSNIGTQKVATSDKVGIAVTYLGGAYLAYGAYLNYQGRINLLPGE